MCSHRSTATSIAPMPMASRPGRQTIGKLEVRAIKGKQDEHGQQRNGRLLKHAEDKTQAKIGQGESRQGREQCGARRVAAQPMGAECPRGLYHAAKQAGEDARVPGHVCIVRPDIDGAHDEEDIGEDGGRIDAEGDGGDIAAALLLRQPPCLPCVEQVSCQDGNRRPGKDVAGDKAEREAAHRRQAHDQQQIRKAAEEQSEEAVDVSCGEPLRLSHRRSQSRAATCDRQSPCGLSAGAAPIAGPGAAAQAAAIRPQLYPAR